MRLCNSLTPPTSLYGSECWNIKVKNKSRIVAAEMTFIRKQFTNQTPINLFKITPVIEKVNVCE